MVKLANWNNVSPLIFLAAISIAIETNSALQISSTTLKQQVELSNQANGTADLTVLINETLAINNKSLPSSGKPLIKLDDWTFDRVEYDLIEFLQDLSARYKLNNLTDPAQLADAILEAKNLPSTTQTTPSTTTTTPSTTTTSKLVENNDTTVGNKPTLAPQLSTSLASGDHEIAESSWQYGIFDRFTRAKSTTSTTTKEPSLILDSDGKLDMRNLNSDDCGLRTYEDQPQYSVQQFEAESEASKELNQRRQRPLLSPLINHKKFQSDSSSMSDESDPGEHDHDRHQADSNSGFDQPSESSTIDSEFNLASRRHWLQQQLGNTLQLLGFNASSQSAFEFINHTSALNLNLRENMMKKSGKLGKSSDLAKAEATLENNLNARQDELKLEARVIGGSDARLGDSPWSVSLQALVSKPGTGGVEYRHYCGGTIISEYYVLTAAHCLDFMVGRESRLFVVIGDLNWRMSATSLYGRRFGIEKLIIHSGYKSTAFGHDIGLIKTKESMRPLRVNGRYIVNSVCLPEKGVEHTGEAELVGWGLFSNRNEMADTLQVADVPILPRPLCVDLYKRRTGLIQWLIGIELITEKQVCAGTFGRGICQGDSGSALVVNEKNFKRRGRQSNKILRNRLTNDQTRATIIGIVAFGGIRRCSYQSLPGVYMQTSKYMDWIVPRIQS